MSEKNDPIIGVEEVTIFRELKQQEQQLKEEIISLEQEVAVLKGRLKQCQAEYAALQEAESSIKRK